MKGNHRQWSYAAALSTVLVAATWTLHALETARNAPPAAQSSRVPQPVMPQYDKSGALLLPEDYRRWVMVGASLGISYSDAPSDHEMFAHTLMEPTAYRHFVETGTFREGTMFALLLQASGDKVLPARRGQFANDVHGVEMAVKDTSHDPQGWAYYGFGGMGSVRGSASAAPKNSCFSCHAEHAARDHVFLQFYPLLTEAAAASKSR
jgi:Cytochrome P460